MSEFPSGNSGPQNPWATLENDEAAPTAAPLKVVLPREPVLRRVGAKDKLVAWTLNGLLPTAAATFAGVILGLSRVQTLILEPFQPSLPETLALDQHLELLLTIGLLLALPLGWAMSALAPASSMRARRWLPLCLLAGGVGQLAAVVPILAARQLELRHVDAWLAARALQNNLEAYLTIAALALYAMVAFVVFRRLQMVRKAAPWVEVVEARSWSRRAVAGLVLASPLLIVVFCAAGAGRIDKPTAAWMASVERLEKDRPMGETRHPRTPWSKLRSELYDKDPTFGSYAQHTPPGKRRWSKAYHQQVEARALALWKASPRRTGEGDLSSSSQVLNALLEHPEDLRKPAEVALAQMQLIVQRPRYDTSLGNQAGVRVLLSALSDPMAAAETERWKKELADLEARLLPPREELDANLVAAFGEYCVTDESEDSGLLRRAADGRIEVRPMRAFGLELPFSPQRMLYEIEASRVLGPWREARSRIDVSSKTKLEMSIWREFSGWAGWDDQELQMLLQFAEGRMVSASVGPVLATGTLLVELRAFHNATGHWPQMLSEVGGAPNVPGAGSAAWSYRRGKDGDAVLTLLAPPGDKKARARSWTLR